MVLSASMNRLMLPCSPENLIRTTIKRVRGLRLRPRVALSFTFSQRLDRRSHNGRRDWY